MSSLSEKDDYRYQAFISYSHQDEKWGDWLHKALERYRVPRNLIGKKTAHTVVPRRLTPIFRDREELPTATDLGKIVNKALQRSASLIVICSPNAARSRWVNKEILTFKRMGRSDRIFCLIVGGEPNAADKPELNAEECLPDALRYVLDPDGKLTKERTEPIAADVRVHGDSKARAKLKLIAGLLGLGLDELKHREQHRRHQRMVAVTATALSVMIITTVLAINAIVARNEADRRREQTENLVSLLAQSHEPTSTRSDIADEALGERAIELCKSGEARLAQGELADAMRAFQDCLASAKILNDRAPRDGPPLFQLGQAFFWIGNVHWQQGQLDAAEKQFLAYLVASQQLVALDPDNKDWQLELSYAYNNLGTLLYTLGNLDGALKQFSTSIEIKELLVAANPGNKVWKLELADSYSWLGSVLQARGELDQALDLHRAQVAIATAVLATDPENAESQRTLSAALGLLGRLMEDLGDLEGAIAQLEQALEISTRLAGHDLENTSWQRDLASAHNGMGHAQWMSGNLSNALAHFRQAAAITEPLLLLAQSNSNWQRVAAVAHNSIGATLLAMGDPKIALQEANTAIEIIGKLLAKLPDDREAILVLSEGHMLLGRISVQTGVGEQPMIAFTRAATLLEPVANGTTDKKVLDPWARALLHVDRVEDARPVIEKLHKTGFKGRQLEELCREKGVKLEG